MKLESVANKSDSIILDQWLLWDRYKDVKAPPYSINVWLWPFAKSLEEHSTRHKTILTQILDNIVKKLSYQYGYQFKLLLIQILSKIWFLNQYYFTYISSLVEPRTFYPHNFRPNFSRASLLVFTLFRVFLPQPTKKCEVPLNKRILSVFYFITYLHIQSTKTWPITIQHY